VAHKDLLAVLDNPNREDFNSRFKENSP
jgi:hypothetical protein